MTVTRFTANPIKYMGLAGDTKPALAIQHAGYLFFETDTGDWFVWTGTAWVAYTTPVLTT